MKTCPFCAKTVQEVDSVCRHCSRSLQGRSRFTKAGGLLVLFFAASYVLRATSGLSGGDWILVLSAIAVASVLLFGVGRTKAIALLAVLGVLAAGSAAVQWWPAGEPAALEAPSRADAEPEQIADRGSGTFRDHAFFYGEVLSGLRQGNIVATFQPPLPRDDATVVAAIAHMVKHHWDEDVNTSTPLLVGREISLGGSGSRYYVLPVKEDTGKVHSLSISRVEH